MASVTYGKCNYDKCNYDKSIYSKSIMVNETKLKFAIELWIFSWLRRGEGIVDIV